MIRHLYDQTVSLDGEWELFWASHEELRKRGECDKKDVTLSTPRLCTRAALEAGGFAHMTTTVPNNFELSLFRAGLCEDPYFGTHTVEMQKYEVMHQFYTRRFEKPKGIDGWVLRFAEIDTAAEVFLNGERILECENMFLCHEADTDGLLTDGENELVVHIKPATIYARGLETDAMCAAQLYNYESLALRKAASSFGWDIMPRLCCGGITGSVELLRRPEVRLDDLFGYTADVNLSAKTARLTFRYRAVLGDAAASAYRLRIVGNCGDRSFCCEEPLRHSDGNLTAWVNDAKFWMPRNAGEANLYEVRATLLYGETVMDAWTFRLGIRTVELERSSVIEPDETGMGCGKFGFRVNGQPIFVLGTNWVPADAFRSQAKSRLREILPMLNDLGCNMVRLWGGNAYEDEELLDFCDENGILIWQDFAMACGIYPQNEAFVGKLRAEAEQVVRRYRGHCSLALWAGDNECDVFRSWDARKSDPNRNILTRRVLPEVLAREDMTRPYLPSSPFVDEKAYATGLPLSEDHIWGPRDWFKGQYYSNTVCRFASEIGYHGCPEPDSLGRFLSADALSHRRFPQGECANAEWLTHAACMEISKWCPYAYRIGLMAEQVQTLFGEDSEDLTRFAAESQISQAEADKYFVETFRIGKGIRTGIIWWNLIDGWPQISDAVVDYYGKKKLAYSYLKRSQTPIALMCAEPKDGEIAVYGVNDLTEPVTVSYRVQRLSDRETVLSGECAIGIDKSVRLGGIPTREGEQEFYLLEWAYTLHAKRYSGKNHYISYLERKINLERYLRGMTLAGFRDGWFV